MNRPLKRRYDHRCKRVRRRDGPTQARRRGEIKLQSSGLIIPEKLANAVVLYYDLPRWEYREADQVQDDLCDLLPASISKKFNVAPIRVVLDRLALAVADPTTVDVFDEIRRITGHQAWADGRLGAPRGSRVRLNDYLLIEERTGLPLEERLARQRALGDEAAACFRAHLPGALERFHHMVVVTHVPPFREACWHEGQISGEDLLPDFAFQATGEALVDSARARPDRTITVLCGHTHGE